MIIAGVMSGSSLDGLDVAVVRIDKEADWSLLYSCCIPYPDDWVERLRDYQSLTAKDYIILTGEYSYLIGELVRDAISEWKVDYVSFHGHTLLHEPSSGFTEQIGNGGIIAGVCGVSTITEFRNQDIAYGGQGTPLAPIVDIALFAGYDYYLNLGGIANITKIEEHKITAYDICPCNQVLNYYSLKEGQPYDAGGQMARAGHYNEAIEAFLHKEDYFLKDAPKSLDNNWIQEGFIPRLPPATVSDSLHTYCKWMAHQISGQIEDDGEKTKMLATGGGAHNTFFMEALKDELLARNCELVIPDSDMIDYKEAILMSLLGYRYLNDEVNVLSSVTGASRDSIGGALHKVS